MTGPAGSRRSIAVVGCGHWGPNHIRVFGRLPGIAVRWAVDESAERRGHVAERYPGVRVTARYEDVLEDERVDAVVVATPAVTHGPLALAALRAGKHVLCEKPMARSSTECGALVAEAAARRRVLMVGHVFLFNAGILALRDLVQGGELGRLHYASAVRANLGPVRTDVNAAWDLASHEIAIFNFLLEAAPVSVSASGRSFGGSGREDVAFITLAYPGGLLAGIMVSWLNPRKVRTLSLVGEGRMATFDDLDPSPLAVHGRGERQDRVEPYYDSYGEFHLLTREIAVTRPAILAVEPLKEQARFFVEALDKGDAGEASGERGWDVVRALEAVDGSMRRGGAPVPIAPIRPEAG